MSVTNPGFRITRWSVVGMEGMFAKMFDPPTASPATPDMVLPTNPVPHVMAAAGLQDPPSTTYTIQRDLLHGMTMPTWDGKKQLVFYTFRDKDNKATGAGNYPGATIRVPRGVVFHCETSAQGPPPHTIHWHGIEPTPMNDGVGHCSMELGQYTYQWQPNFIGTYFYHCHRNTMQHFEFGLFGLLLIEPPDAYFATQVIPTIPIGHCRDGKRRTAANLLPTAANPAGFPQFPGFNSNLVSAPDPWTGDPSLKFDTDPHAMTVPYDVEALWVFDDRDSVWSDLAPDARATYPRHGQHPGIDDEFTRNPGQQGFFAFNDFNADYWFVTGVPVPAAKGGVGTIDPAAPAPLGGGLPNGQIPAALNSGVAGTQIAVNAKVGDTILIRSLDAAYNATEITFPVDVVVIAWDGRALGVAPYGYNEPYLVPANTPIFISTARRFDALVRATAPINSFATVNFINTRGVLPGAPPEVVCTAKIPFNIVAAAPATGVTLAPSVASPQPGGTQVAFTATGAGGQGAYQYRFWLYDGTAASWSMVRDWAPADTWTLPDTTAAGKYVVAVDVRTSETVTRDAVAYLGYEIQASPATAVTITPDQPSPHQAGSPVVFTANGNSPGCQYRFWLFDAAAGSWAMVQDYGVGSTWQMPASTAMGDYVIAVDARTSPLVARDTVTYLSYQVFSSTPATGVSVSPDQPVHAAGTDVVFTATGIGSAGYQYRFWIYDVAAGLWSLAQDYGVGASWTMLAADYATGTYVIAVDVRTSTAVTRDTVTYFTYSF